MKLSHLVDAEYGNQGIDFKMVPREGFGWMNGIASVLQNAELHSPPHSAAYQVGLSFLNSHMRRAVAACTSPEVFFSAANNGTEQVLQDMTSDPLGLAMDSLEIVTQD